MKVKLFTHTDLDGVGCVILANQVFGATNVDYKCVDYDKIDEKVKEFILTNEYRNYDLILITDISVNEEVAEIINDTVNSQYVYGDTDADSRHLILLDHHDTAKWLNKYWWATVTPVKVVESLHTSDSETMHKQLIGELPETVKTAGTSMLYDYFNSEGYFFHQVSSPFVETVRRWDTWDWFNVYNDEQPKILNSLLYLIGREKFINRFSADINMKFTDGENLLLEVESERINKYIKKVSQNILTKRIGDYIVGIVFAEQYISELGNVLANENPNLDFIAIINLGGGTVSYRGIKNEIHLGNFAKTLGGGGHPNAAGSRLPKAINEIIIKQFFELVGGHKVE